MQLGAQGRNERGRATVAVHLRPEGCAGIHQEGGEGGEGRFRGDGTCKALWWQEVTRHTD